MKLKPKLGSLTKALQGLAKTLNNDFRDALKNLALLTKAKMVELASQKLDKNQIKKFTEGVSVNKIDENIYELSMGPEASMIEEGNDQKVFMEWLLNAKNTKINKKGEKYTVIPFRHNVTSKPSSGEPTSSQQVASEIKKYMKDNKIDTKKIELDKDGSPRIGLLHSFDVGDKKAKPYHSAPLGRGVRVYQTKDAAGKVSKSVLTFRIIKESHKEQGKWFAKPKKGANISDQALDLAIQMWERELFPQMKSKYDPSKQ